MVTFEVISRVYALTQFCRSCLCDVHQQVSPQVIYEETHFGSGAGQLPLKLTQERIICVCPTLSFLLHLPRDSQPHAFQVDLCLAYGQQELVDASEDLHNISCQQ